MECLVKVETMHHGKARLRNVGRDDDDDALLLLVLVVVMPPSCILLPAVAELMQGSVTKGIQVCCLVVFSS